MTEPVRNTQPVGIVLNPPHPRNSLNDLSGSEWVHFLSSVEATAYPTTGPQSYRHNLRRVHPSPKPPQLMARIVEFFTRQGRWCWTHLWGLGVRCSGARWRTAVRLA